MIVIYPYQISSTKTNVLVSDMHCWVITSNYQVITIISVGLAVGYACSYFNSN